MKKHIVSGSLIALALSLGACATTPIVKSSIEYANEADITRDELTGSAEVFAPYYSPTSWRDSVDGDIRLHATSGDGAYLEIGVDYFAPTPDPYDARIFDRAYWAGGVEAEIIQAGDRLLGCEEQTRQYVSNPGYYYGGRHGGHYGYGTFAGGYYGNGRHRYRRGRGYPGGRSNNHDSLPDAITDLVEDDLADDRRDRSDRGSDRRADRRGEGNESGRGGRRGDRSGTGRDDSSTPAYDPYVAPRTADEKAKRPPVMRRPSESDLDDNYQHRNTKPQVSPRAEPRPSVSRRTAPKPQVSPRAEPRPSVSRRTTPKPQVSRRPQPKPSVAPRPQPQPQPSVAPAPKPRPASKPKARPAPRSAPKREVETPRSAPAKPARRSAPRIERRAEVKTGFMKANFSATTGYGYTYPGTRTIDTNTRLECERREFLVVYIPQERLEHAESHGLHLVLRSQSGDSVDMVIPVNYVLGFQIARSRVAI